ncbi:MAG: adenylosuccinate synthase [Spirochaetia bacterium]|nr:adenylosuccinate synthase [Spirochaetia bacterium]
MAVTLIVGAQWGDEGKAKVIDFLAENTDIVVRYQGGANAGHTVIAKGEKYIFHLIPSGILYSKTVCVLGGGMVIEPNAFFDELNQLEKRGIEIDGRIRIADNAHVLLPYHSLIDAKREENMSITKIGTTKRGIGICYGDKVNRTGIRIGELLDDGFYKNRLPLLISEKNIILKNIYNEKEINLTETEDFLRSLGQKLKKYLINAPYYLNLEIASGKRVLLEGAQGTMLDVDFGTYPFVTSSNPTIGGALIGSGVNHRNISDCFGIVKAYTTRVGEGPFPTEAYNEEGEALRKLGNEYGATTGRPRRCGWFDVEVVRHAARINGLTGIVLTKLDVLDSLKTIKIAVGYEQDGKRISYFPSYGVERIKVIYEELPGWEEPITNYTKLNDLPKNAKKYINAIEKFCGVPVCWVSVGPKRENTIKIR